MNDIVIVGARRTPLGSFQGQLKGYTAPQLGSHALRGVLERTALDPEQIDTVLMGCVLTAGLGQSPARQAALGAGLPSQVRTTTLNKVCGSGLQTIMMAYDMIRSGSARLVLAGGMESMTQAPYLLPTARKGLKFGHASLLDHMLLDGLEDAYSGQSMGLIAEETAATYGFSRADQDAFALETSQRAQKACREALFRDEIVPLTQSDQPTLDQDEPPLKVVVEKIPRLKPAFLKEGTITAATASGLCDGAAAVALMPLPEAERQGLQPMARIVAHAGHAHEPSLFTTAPVQAIRNVLHHAGWEAHQVDLYEINEAFAVVTMAAMKDLSLPHEKVNVRGGACALGHPIGASGARIVVTLLHALQQTQTRKGVASLCIGGGESVAIALERL